MCCFCFTYINVYNVLEGWYSRHYLAYFGHREHELPGGGIEPLILLRLGILLARLLVLRLLKLVCFGLPRLCIHRRVQERE